MSELKKRVSNVLAFARLIFHWSYIPFVIYLGNRKHLFIRTEISFIVNYVLKGFKKGADEGQPPLNVLQ